MSAFAGLIHWSGQGVPLDSLQSMAAALNHHGVPAIHREGGVGLCLVSVPRDVSPPVPGSPHPAVDPSTGRVTVLEGRIDNRDELAVALGERFRGSEDDPTVVARTLAECGRDGVSMLVGEFCFASWDPQRRELSAGRDALGVKPLYYHAAPHRLAFATELPALLALEGVAGGFDPTAVAGFVAGLFDDTESTFYAGIRRLPPGHSLTASADRLDLARYWCPSPTDELRLGSDAEYAEAFGACFRDAVRCRLPSEGALGSTLSGGLDSSSIACVARDVLGGEGRTLHTFSAVFPGLSARDLRVADEREYAEAAVAGGGLEAHWVRADTTSALEGVDGVMRGLGQPAAAANLYIHRLLYAACEASGVRVLLDGFDGDTSVSHGLEGLADLARSGRWVTLAREARALGQRSPRRLGTWDVIKTFGVRPTLPTGVLYAWDTLRGRSATEPVAGGMPIAPELARLGHLEARERESRADAARHRAGRAAHVAALASPAIPLTLETAAHAAAGWGLETRYPFFDRRLVELCLAMPGDQKLRDGWTRWILRRGVAGTLPEKIRWRTSKADLSPQLRRSIAETERAALDDLFLRRAASIPGLGEWLDLVALPGWYEGFKADPTPRGSFDVFRLASLAIWLETKEAGPN